MAKKKVYIAYTGGTIGMKPSDQGFVPQKGFLGATLQSFPEFQHPDMPEITIHDYAEPIDSANMSPEDWHQIAEDIERNYDDYDGFYFSNKHKRNNKIKMTIINHKTNNKNTIKITIINLIEFAPARPI